MLVAGVGVGGGCVCSCLSHAALQLCKVCSDNAINVVLVPCGHMCLCGVCAGKRPLARACDLSAYRCMCVCVAVSSKAGF